MSKELIAIVEGREMGRMAQDGAGKLSFTYNEQWRNAADAYPLSISMPLALTAHGKREDRSVSLGTVARQQSRIRSMGAPVPRLLQKRFRADCQRRGGLRRRGPVCPAG